MNEIETRPQQVTSGMMEAVSNRAVAEIQGMMTVAKRFPRDETASYNRIIKACQRPNLAEHALYAYPRGGQTVSGPSIRLAETLARNWGNLDVGVVELEQKNGESTMMAYALDLETNFKESRVFVVKHERDTKQGKKTLTDGRDIYELTANQGSRRLRACILAVIPGDVIEAAEKECEKTLKGQTGVPLVDRIRQMVVAFNELGVTQEMLEKRLKHKIDVCIEAELLELKKIFRSIKDNFTGRSEWFEFTSTGEPASKGEGAAESLNAAVKSKPAAKKTEPDTDPNSFENFDKQGKDDPRNVK